MFVGVFLVGTYAWIIFGRFAFLYEVGNIFIYRIRVHEVNPCDQFVCFCVFFSPKKSLADKPINKCFAECKSGSYFNRCVYLRHISYGRQTIRIHCSSGLQVSTTTQRANLSVPFPCPIIIAINFHSTVGNNNW